MSKLKQPAEARNGGQICPRPGGLAHIGGWPTTRRVAGVFPLCRSPTWWHERGEAPSKLAKLDEVATGLRLGCGGGKALGFVVGEEGNREDECGGRGGEEEEQN